MNEFKSITECSNYDVVNEMLKGLAKQSAFKTFSDLNDNKDYIVNSILKLRHEYADINELTYDTIYNTYVNDELSDYDYEQLKNYRYNVESLEDFAYFFDAIKLNDLSWLLEEFGYSYHQTNLADLLK